MVVNKVKREVVGVGTEITVEVSVTLYICRRKGEEVRSEILIQQT